MVDNKIYNHLAKINLKFAMTLVLLFISFSSFTFALDFPKNINILETNKSDKSRIEDMNDLEEIEKRIFEKKENTIIVFYAEWCHHCKEFLPNFEEASKYDLAKGFNFMKVNCQNKSICNHFDVKHYPTIKFFNDGHKSNEEPGRDIASILEFIQKLTTPAIVEINSEEDIQEFRRQYGENSFVVYYDGDKDSEWFKCIENLAENKYKSHFYFGIYKDNSKEDLNKEKIHNKFKIQYNEKYAISHNWTGFCLDVENFVESNLFPIIRKLDSNYIKRIQKENKKLVMAAVSIKNSVHMYFIENIMAEVSVENRRKKGNYVFAFIDADLDAYLINYFKIDLNKLPRIIIYDFEDKRYYVDLQDKLIYEKEESALKYLRELVEKANNPGELSWTTGNFFEDILAKFGLRLNQSGVIYIVGGLFAILAVFFLIVVFYCGDKNEEEEAKRLFENQINTKEQASKTSKSDESEPQNLTDKKNQ